MKLRTLLPVLALGLAHLQSHAADAIVAKVGSTEIPAGTIKSYLNTLPATDREALGSNPTVLNQLVRSIILQQVLYKEALSAGWDKKPEVQEQVQRAEQNAVVDSYLQTVAKVPDNYPSDSDVAALYEARKSALLVPQQYRLAQIFVAAPKDGDKATQDAAQAKVDAIVKALKQGDFAAVARAQSEEPGTAAQGGEVGWLAETSIQPEIKSKVQGSAKNSVTEPIRLNDGWYVIKVLDVNGAHTASLDEVRPQLVKLLRQDRARANRDAYLARLQQQNPVSINELGLNSLLGDAPKQ